MDVQTQTVLISATGVVLAALIAGLFAWLGTRNKTTREEFEKENRKLKDENERLTKKIGEVESHLEQEIRERRIADQDRLEADKKRQLFAEQVIDLQKEVVKLTALNDKLLAEIRRLDKEFSL